MIWSTTGSMTSGIWKTKSIVFIALMSALGNVLSFISISASPIVPSVPLGPVSVSLAFDMSHLTTFIAALFGGPVVGGLTGLIGGMVAAYQFGFSQGNYITGFALPIGKALTGIAAGIIMSSLRILNRRRILMIPTTIMAYIPEALFTAVLFIVVFPQVFYMPIFMATIIAIQIIVKAFIEMVIMGVLVSGLLANRSFVGYIKGLYA